MVAAAALVAGCSGSSESAAPAAAAATAATTGPGTTAPATTAPATTAPAPVAGPPSDRGRLALKTTFGGAISPKSVAASGTGLVFAQNMMYRHSVTVYDARRLR